MVVRLPAGAEGRSARVTVLRLGEVAAAVDGRRLERVDAAELSGAALPPGAYVVRVWYRGRLVIERAVPVISGSRARMELPAAKLAAIEYDAGVARARDRDDLRYFRRAVRLDPRHTPAHLQLAAAALFHGNLTEAESRAGLVRTLDPGNPHANRIARLIRQMRRRQR